MLLWIILFVRTGCSWKSLEEKVFTIHLFFLHQGIHKCWFSHICVADKSHNRKDSSSSLPFFNQNISQSSFLFNIPSYLRFPISQSPPFKFQLWLSLSSQSSSSFSLLSTDNFHRSFSIAKKINRKITHCCQVSTSFPDQSSSNVRQIAQFNLQFSQFRCSCIDSHLLLAAKIWRIILNLSKTLIFRYDGKFLLPTKGELSSVSNSVSESN